MQQKLQLHVYKKYWNFKVLLLGFLNFKFIILNRQESYYLCCPLPVVGR